jgi:hypothetical protein
VCPGDDEWAVRRARSKEGENVDDDRR